MTPPRDVLETEILGNREAFRAALPTLLGSHAGRYAVYRHRELIRIFDKFGDALAYCGHAFSDRVFSIQEITAEATDMGWFAHASAEIQIRPDLRADH
jgi:hypothetical protein